MTAFKLFSLIIIFCTTIPIAEAETKIAQQPVQKQGKTMDVIIEKSRFSVDLADTIAAQELQQLLPLTLYMQDHLRNEKYAELPRHLHRDDKVAGRIEAGDVMLWQGNILVVFYKSFNSSYQYTRLGKIHNIEDLKNILGADNINMHFVVAD